MTIAPGRIVTQDRDRYRVDGYLMDPAAIPADTSVPFELEMKCFELPAWYELSTADLICVERPTTPGGYYCGEIECGPDATTWDPAEVFNDLNQEICQNGVDESTFDQQSTAEYQTASVAVDVC